MSDDPITETYTTLDTTTFEPAALSVNIDIRDFLNHGWKDQRILDFLATVNEIFRGGVTEVR